MSNKLIISSDTFSFSDKQSYSGNETFIVIKGDIKEPVKINRIIKVVLYYVSGDRVQYTTNANLCTTYQLNAMLSGESVLLEERRRFYKLKITMCATVINVMNEDREVIDEEEFPVLIKDINIGGVFIECKNNKFNINDYINIKIKLCNCEMILFAKVLRTQRVEDNVEGFGCCFINIRNRHEEIIAKYINQIQRERMDQIKLNLEKR